MDLATLVTRERLAEALERMAARFAREERPFSVLMMVPTLPGFSQTEYSVVASAPWLDTLLLGDAIPLLREAVTAEVGSPLSPEMRLVNRISIKHSADPFVLAAGFRLRNQTGWIGPTMIGSIEVPESYVVTARPPEIPQAVPLAEAAPEPVRRRKVG